MTLLSSLNGPQDLKRLDQRQLIQLCADIRTAIIDTVAGTGGHLGSSLGVVELTALIGYYTMVAMTLNCHDIPLPDGVAPPLPPAPE